MPFLLQLGECAAYRFRLWNKISRTEQVGDAIFRCNLTFGHRDDYVLVGQNPYYILHGALIYRETGMAML